MQKEIKKLLKKYGRKIGWVAGRFQMDRATFSSKLHERDRYTPFTPDEQERIKTLIITGK